MILIVFFSGFSAKAQQVKLVRDDAGRKVDVLVGGKLFTSYIYPSEEVLKKPVLFPIATSKGTLVTRGWPMAPRAGERTDHPHHVGMWLNYESVNGFDYWNNSTAIAPDKRKEKYGLIRHTGIKTMKSGKVGKLVVTADWVEHDGTGRTVMKELTEYRFTGRDSQRMIERITTLTATDSAVTFKDAKDGMIAIRVARQLEQPSDKAEVFTDALGNETKVAVVNNEGIVGKYRSSEGIEGDAVWSTRGKWVRLSGKIGDEEITLAMLDDARNVGYPTYWHARGYGLFAANSLGAKVFSNGKKELNYTLKAGESVTFRYRLVVQTGQVSDIELEGIADKMGK